MPAHAALLRRLAAIQKPLRASAKAPSTAPPEVLDRAVQAMLERLALAAFGEAQGMLPAGALDRIAAGLASEPTGNRLRVRVAREAPWAPQLLTSTEADEVQFGPGPIASTVAALQAAPDCVTAELAGRLHERLVAATSTAHGGTRKSRGVFYTPQFVTEYLVSSVLRARYPDSRAPLLLDPACGSGAFLLEALRQLRSRAPHGEPGAALRAVCSVHGVDLDQGAVEIARFCLVAESGAEPHEATAVVVRNIRCGNALLSPDGAKVAARGAFDWSAAYPAICGPGAPGFDAVVGNPPFRRELNQRAALEAIAATPFGASHRAPRMDLWYYFVHRGLELLAPGGLLAFVVNAYWLAGSGSRKLIATLRDEHHVEEIFDLGALDVFDGVSGKHLLLTVRKGRSDRPTCIRLPFDGATGSAEPLVREVVSRIEFLRPEAELFRGGRVDIRPAADGLLESLARWPALGTLGRVRQGIAENPSCINPRLNARFGGRFTVGEGVFVLTADEAARLPLSDAERALLRPYHQLRDLGRYRCATEASRRLIYSTPATWPERDRFPALRDHLARFRRVLEQRRETRMGRIPWWQLHWPREDALWRTPKIVALQMAACPSFAVAGAEVCVPFSANLFVADPDRHESLDYFAGVLNSSLLRRWFEHHAKRRGVGLEINVAILAKAPMPAIDFARGDERRLHDEIADAARRRRETAAGDPDGIQAPDRLLDGMVAELFKVDAVGRGESAVGT